MTLKTNNSDLDAQQIFRQHETEKNRQYASRVLEVEQAIFTPLVFITTGRIRVNCNRYHSRVVPVFIFEIKKFEFSLFEYSVYSFIILTLIIIINYYHITVILF